MPPARGDRAEDGTDLVSRHKGFHTHRLKDNPLEAKILAAWQEANLAASSPRGGDLLDIISHIDSSIPTYRSQQEATLVATVLQWLGSPAGFAWLVDTLGLEVVRAMRHRTEGGAQVAPGQIYRVSRGCDARQVVVERMRYGVDHALFRLGPNTHWTVQNGDTGRRSYIRERILLDENVWKLVK